MAETIFSWVFLLASGCGFIFAYFMVQDLACTETEA
jgi:hypothetical protein